jgi:hypothetical protein
MCAAQIHASGFNLLSSGCRMTIRELPLGRLVSSLCTHPAVL